MRLHHFGVLVENIEEASRDYVENFGYEICSDIIHDPLQTACVRFLALPSESTYLELVSPDSPQSKLQNALRQAPGLHHLCYSTASIELAMEHLNRRGAMIIREPVPAVAFRDKRIAWLVDRNCTLVELVERGTNEELDFPSRRDTSIAVSRASDTDR
jgi:methylmalonyl-CoA/ethylmalonyl-CoA epimerase